MFKKEKLNLEDLRTEPEIQAALEMLEGYHEDGFKTRGMEFYSPNPMQYKAHQSTARIICFCGGNRSGKSTFGVMELCYHLTKNYPDWFPKKRRLKGLVKTAVSATEFPIIARVIEPKIFQFLPRDYFSTRRSGSYLSRIVCQDGSTVDLLTSEMKDEAYESADWDFVWCDEPQQQRKYQAILRGLVDRGGQMVITFTPLTEPWMKEELVDKADGKLIQVFQVDLRDNMFTLDGRAIQSEENIQIFENSLPEDVRETRIHGKFFHLRGAVYKEFGEEHIKDFEYKYPDPVVCVLDPHDRLPHHVLWASIDREDDVFIDYEFVKHCELDELAGDILAIEKKRGYKMRKRLIDPNFGMKPAASGSNISVMQELARHGAGFYEADDDKELGHMIVRDYLHFNKSKPVTAVNRPKLFFSRERTPVTIRSMKNLQYSDWSSGVKEDRNLKEIEKDKENHGADCIRYLLIKRPLSKNLLQTAGYELESSPY